MSKFQTALARELLGGEPSSYEPPMDREFHEVANIFPMMNETEFAELRADIQANGLLEPIWLEKNGKIVDGRNRYTACRQLGIEPKYQAVKPGTNLLEFVVSLNLKRRHLTTGQKTCVALEMLPYIEADAKERRKQGALRGSRVASGLEPKNDSGRKGKNAMRSSTIVAKAVGGIGKNTVDRAIRLKKEFPELFSLVASGKTTITAAYSKAYAKKYEKWSLGHFLGDNARVIKQFQNKAESAIGRKVLNGKLVETAFVLAINDFNKNGKNSAFFKTLQSITSKGE
jgi:hypothetical protein